MTDSVMALATFSVPSEAKRAFNHLSYRKYQHTPLYLEYLPIGLGSEEPSDAPAVRGEEAEDLQANESSEASFAEPESLKRDQAEVAIGDESDSTTLYVKNLSWKTSEESLRRLFGRVEGLKSVTIPKKKTPAGELLPIGFGFVVYETREQALRALNRLNGKALDGHVLELKFSARKDVVTTKKRKVTSKAKDEETRTKLLVRNIPFEATRSELRELFGSFGQLKSLRLPKKFDGTSRGFVFVEYVSGDDAKTAVKALASTHLLGRKLVVEYAKEETNASTQSTHMVFEE